VLEANNVGARFVQELSRFHVFVDVVVLNFQVYGFRILIGATRICHCYDAGLKIGTRRRNRSMKILSERGNATDARKMIADECYFLDWLH
jgi:hypothetical protein